MKNTNKVLLYIGTHNTTKLKYFGKTTKYFTEELLQEKYHGSGKYWKRHLKKHGDNVTMEVYGIYNLDEVQEIALKFSEDNDIVESREWANLKPENGLDGGVCYFSKNTRKKISKANKGKIRTESFKQGVSNIHKGKVLSLETKQQISNTISKKTKQEKLEISDKISNSLMGRKQDPEVTEKIRNTNLGRKNTTESIIKMKKAKQNISLKSKEKMSEAAKNRPKVKCPYCIKEGPKASMVRWHFENCKFKNNDTFEDLKEETEKIIKEIELFGF